LPRASITIVRGATPVFRYQLRSHTRNLLESELFGYEKGAFTGAVTRHIGLFEQANHSTLLLDEIGDLTSAMQAKVLRTIQEKEIRRIGGKETIKLDVRIIAATNKKLEEEIKTGRFRQDLYYRLNVIAFTIPPLKERMTDIPVLVEHFLKRLNESHVRKKNISNDALQLLMGYSWPGNVRQLESVIERAYVMCDEDTIDAEHMPEEIKQVQEGQFVQQTFRHKNGIHHRRETDGRGIQTLPVSLKPRPPGRRVSGHDRTKENHRTAQYQQGHVLYCRRELKELGLYDFKLRSSLGKSPASPGSSEKSPSKSPTELDIDSRKNPTNTITFQHHLS